MAGHFLKCVQIDPYESYRGERCVIGPGEFVGVCVVDLSYGTEHLCPGLSCPSLKFPFHECGQMCGLNGVKRPYVSCTLLW